MRLRYVNFIKDYLNKFIILYVRIDNYSSETLTEGILKKYNKNWIKVNDYVFKLSDISDFNTSYQGKRLLKGQIWVEKIDFIKL